MPEGWFQLEGDPTPRQQETLDRFLQELAELSRRTGVLLVGDALTGLSLFDVPSRRVVGIGLQPWMRDTAIRYTPEDSILDEAWLDD